MGPTVTRRRRSGVASVAWSGLGGSCYPSRTTKKDISISLFGFFPFQSLLESIALPIEVNDVGSMS